MDNPTACDDDVIRQQLLEIIAKEAMVPREKLIPEAKLSSLGVESYEIVMAMMAIEEKYGVYVSVDAELDEASTLDDMLKVLVKKIQKGTADKAEIERE